MCAMVQATAGSATARARIKKEGLVQAGNLKNMSLSEHGFLFDPVTGLTYTLNKVGILIFKQLENNKTVQEIVNILTDKYDITKEQAAEDVNEFIFQLKEYDLLQE